MSKRTAFGFVFLLVICAASARNTQSNRSATQPQPDDKTQLPPAYVPSGRQMYREYVRRATAPMARAAVLSRRPCANRRPISQHSPAGTAGPFPNHTSPMSSDSDPAFRLTVLPRCPCGGPSFSISRITMKLQCGSASRICAITSSRSRRNDRQGA
jgi:hypothetical protein